MVVVYRMNNEGSVRLDRIKQVEIVCLVFEEELCKVGCLSWVGFQWTFWIVQGILIMPSRIRRFQVVKRDVFTPSGTLGLCGALVIAASCTGIRVSDEYTIGEA